jgi:hypothetical protein
MTPRSHLVQSSNGRRQGRTTNLWWVVVIGALNLAAVMLVWFANGVSSPGPDPLLARWLADLPFGNLRPLAAALLKGFGPLLDWRLLRYLAIANMAAFIPVAFGARFIQQLYRFGSFAMASSYLKDSMFDSGSLVPHTSERVGEPEHGRSAGERAAQVQDGRMVPVGQHHRSLSLFLAGGPGLVVTRPYHAAQLERGGQLGRVVGPGAARLGRLEKVYRLVDLRQMTRARTLSSLTRDGIRVTVEVTVFFRLRAFRPASDTAPYVVDPGADRRVTQDTVVDEAGLGVWEEQPIRLAAVILNNLLAAYRLDELYEPFASGIEPRTAIRDRLLRELRKRTRAQGVEVTQVLLGPFETPPVVTDLYLQRQRTDRYHRPAVSPPLSSDESLELDRVTAEAKEHFVSRLVSAIRPEGVQNGGTDYPTSTALRLVDALEALCTESACSAGKDKASLAFLAGLRRRLEPGHTQGQGQVAQDDANVAA